MLKPCRSNMRRTIVAAFACATLLCASSAPVALAKFRPFRTPSGNIGCYVDGNLLRCDIQMTIWSMPHRPLTCIAAYGDSFTLTPHGRTKRICHSDSALGSGRAVPYGTTVRIGPFTVKSRVTGLTCTNLSGHGFFLSRQSFRTF